MYWVDRLKSFFRPVKEKELENIEPPEEVELLTPKELAEIIAVKEGPTLEEESEGKSELKKEKMQKIIDQKKNRTPFYKDDNKKNWE